MIAQLLLLIVLTAILYGIIDNIVRTKLYKQIGLYSGIFSIIIIFVMIAGVITLSNTKKEEKIVINTSSVVIKDTINRQACWEYIIKSNISHPKVVLAQAIEESKFESAVFKQYHNLFGMKKSYQRVSIVSTKDIGQYKYYDDWMQSINDYALWQLQQDIDNMDDLQYIDFLANKYAENPKYKQNLIKIYNTIKYD